jgi:hypothetical protein
MKVLRFGVNKDDGFMTIIKRGGKHDGLQFDSGTAEMDDGSMRTLWVCNDKKGFFKQVFVPWNFNHSKIIE